MFIVIAEERCCSECTGHVWLYATTSSCQKWVSVFFISASHSSVQTVTVFAFHMINLSMFFDSLLLTGKRNA